MNTELGVSTETRERETVKDSAVLKGFRRELTRKIFEELAALQCTPEEVEGYIGTDRQQMEKWCRKVYGRRYSLDQLMRMLRQDGLIEIRRASFEQLKKSATLIGQQYNRFLPHAGHEEETDAESSVRAFAAMLDDQSEADMEELFRK